MAATKTAMDDQELNKFVHNSALGSLFVSGTEMGTKIRAVCSTAMALGYDENWVKNVLKPELEKTYL